MNIRIFPTLGVIFWATICGALAQVVPPQFIRYAATESSKLTIHTVWRPLIQELEAKTSSIDGFMELWPDIKQIVQDQTPRLIRAKAQACVAITNLTGRNKIISEAIPRTLRADQHPNIVYNLKELARSQPGTNKEEACSFDSIGELILNGVTNKVSMPVSITAMGSRKIKITGNLSVKVTDFKIQRPSTSTLRHSIMDDAVSIDIEWVVARVD